MHQREVPDCTEPECGIPQLESRQFFTLQTQKLLFNWGPTRLVEFHFQKYVNYLWLSFVIVYALLIASVCFCLLSCLPEDWCRNHETQCSSVNKLNFVIILIIVKNMESAKNHWRSKIVLPLIIPLLFLFFIFRSNIAYAELWRDASSSIKK